MKYVLGIALVASAVAPVFGQLAVVDFEEFTAGDQFGPGSPAGQDIGDPIFASKGVAFSVAEFLPPPSATGFVEIAGPGDSNFSTQFLEFVGNTAVDIDFSGLGADVTRVELEWFDNGGTVVIGHNTAAIGISDFELGGFNIGGVRVTGTNQNRSTNTPGTLVFEGDIRLITIGGQNLALDNIVVIPAPSAGLACAALGLVSTSRRRR